MGIFGFGADASFTTEVGKLGRLERFGSIEQVWEVEVGNVVADDDIRVDLLNEFGPSLEHVDLLVERKHLTSDDVRAGVEREDVLDKGRRFALPCDHVGDLDDGVDGGFWEDALAPRTLDIEAQNPERGDLGPVAFRGMGYEGMVSDSRFSIREQELRGRRTERRLLFGKCFSCGN